MKKIRTSTLKKQILKTNIAILLLMSIACGIILFWNYTDHQKYRQMLVTKSIQNHFYQNLHNLVLQTGDCIKLHSYPEDLTEQIDGMKYQSEQLSVRINDPAYQELSDSMSDLQSIAEECNSSIETHNTVRLMEELNTLQESLQRLLNSQYELQEIENTVFEKRFDLLNNEHFGQYVCLLIFVLLIYLAGIILSFQLSGKISRPLSELAGDVESIPEDFQNCTISPEEYSVTEITQLQNSITQMVHILRNQFQHLEDEHALRENVRKLELENTQHKLQSIHDMINPHFLYNCLGVITNLAYIEDAPQTREAALTIVTYLRSTLKNAGKLISVEAEVKSIQAYTTIQQLRFDEQISFSVTIQKDDSALTDDFLSHCCIPAMTLQPLVENAIVHGLSAREEGGIIEVHVQFSANQIRFRINDNGKGMDQKTAQAAMDFMQTEDSDHQALGIGLRSTLFQLKHAFGKQAFLTITSVKDQSTCVELIIPAFPL